MQVTDPAITFLLVLAIGIIAGLLFDRLAGPSWLARQFSGSTRGIITSALVGVAGAFVGYHAACALRRDAGCNQTPAEVARRDAGSGGAALSRWDNEGGAVGDGPSM